MATRQGLEQEALTNILGSPETGGSASGALGEGADVPAVLEANPATRQLLEEAVATRTGRSVVTSDAARGKVQTLQERLAEMQRQVEERRTVPTTTTTPPPTTTTTTPPPTTTTTTPPPTTTTTTPTDTTTGDTYLQDQLASLQAGYELQAQSHIDALDAFSATMNAQNQDLVNNIKAKYARRVQQMQVLNANTLGAQTKIGIRAGRQRYAPEIQTSILTSEEAAGIGRVADLHAEEAGLILKAERANTACQFMVLNKKMQQLDELHTKKVELVNNLHDMAIDQERMAISRASEQREAMKFEREEEESLIESVSGTIYGSLTGDTVSDQKLIEDASRQYGVDPNKLMQATNEYGQAQELTLLEIATTYYDAGRDLQRGETWTDPNTGVVIEGTGDHETLELEQVIGNTAYKVRYDVSDPANPVELFRLNLGAKWKGGGDTTTNESDIPSHLSPIEQGAWAMAADIVDLENALGDGVGQDRYWALIDQFATTEGVSVEQADFLVMNQIRSIKDQQPTESINTNIGSDFVDEGPPQASQRQRDGFFGAEESKKRREELGILGAVEAEAEYLRTKVGKTFLEGGLLGSKL